MATKWWESAPIVEQPQGRTFIPNPAGIADAQRDQTRTDIAVEGNERDEVRLGDQQSNDRRDASFRLSDAYNKDKEVAGYRESLGNFAAALRTAPNPQGDNALITVYVKVFDPGSVVNEGEREGVATSQGALNSMIEKAKRDFGMDDAGLFTPEARKRIRREMSSIMSQRNKAYNQRRAFYRQQAEGFELDPELIIGTHDGRPFREQFEAYDQANGIGEQPPEGGLRTPIPGATPDNIAFDIDTGTGAFGSQIEGGRLFGPQQEALTAFLRANSGNPDFGPEQLDAFYKSIGVQGAGSGDDAFFDAVRTGQAFGTKPDYSATDEARRQWAEGQVRAEIGNGDISATPLIDKGITLNLSDEIMGVGGGLEALLRGESPIAGYQNERDIERAAQGMARSEYGIAPELLSSLLVPAGVVNKASIARDAAAMAAIAGFGEGEGLTDTIGKTVTSGALGYGAGKVVEAAAPMVANTPLGQSVGNRLSNAFGQGRKQAAQDFVEAADRQGIDYMAADVPGAYKSKFATGVTGMTLGGVPLKVAAGKIVDKAKAAKDRIAGNVGNAGDNAATGQSTQRGMEAWERRTEGRGGQLFDAIPIDPGTSVDLTAAKQTLSEINGALSSNPQLASLVRDPKLVAYQKALESGPLSWGDTKAFRSYIGKVIGKPGLTSDGASDDALRALYGSLSQDMERAAAAHSTEAAKAFSRANQYWRGRQSRIDDVMTKIVGKDRNLSAEQATAQIERWAQAKGGDFNKLSRAVRSLPDDEANSVRAYFIDRMGMANAGGQDASAEVFSPDVWMTNWNKLSPRAKAVLFQGEHRKALDDLAQVFSGMKSSRLFANPSGTGYSVWGATNAAMASADLMAFGLSSVGQVGAGALLGSPRIARWLTAWAKKPNPSAQLAHINQLTAIARAEPVIANDIFSLQERLANAFAEPLPGRLAVEENDPEGQGPPESGKRDDAQ